MGGERCGGERTEQSTKKKCDPRLGESHVDCKMPANTYMHIYTAPPPHRHPNTHSRRHTGSEQGPFCRLTGANVSPELQVCVVVVMMMMVEVVRLGPHPLPRQLRSERDPSNDSHRREARH